MATVGEDEDSHFRFELAEQDIRRPGRKPLPGLGLLSQNLGARPGVRQGIRAEDHYLKEEAWYLQTRIWNYKFLLFLIV
jgi:hypothetical protein